jgi:NAD-dependent deacetylase
VRLALDCLTFDTGSVIDEAAAALSERKRILVFTGAGISTESGIPDYRGPQGLWKRFDPDDYTYGRYLDDAAFRARSWKRHFTSPFLGALPNDAHRAVTLFWASGRSVGCVTQNIDGLHTDARLPGAALVEIHGNAHRVHCVSCGDEPAFDEIKRRWESGESDPRCLRCGGILKIGIVYFGEDPPRVAMARAWQMAEEADAVLVVGSTLSVYPAAFIPLDVADRGNPMVIVNQGPTDHDYRATVLLDGAAGTVLPKLIDRLLGN